MDVTGHVYHQSNFRPLLAIGNSTTGNHPHPTPPHPVPNQIKAIKERLILGGWTKWLVETGQ
jgi:hypothetical protein